MTTGLLLLDLDGTLRETKSGAKFINQPKDQKLIPEAAEALKRWTDAGWLAVGITNQGGVQAGHKSMASCIEEQTHTLSLAEALNLVIFCPNAGESCIVLTRNSGVTEIVSNRWGSYRKPGPGMLLTAMEAHPTPGAILMVGDRPEDQASALAAEVQFMWAKDWWLNNPAME